MCVDHIEQALTEGECQVLDSHQIDTALEDLIVEAASRDGSLPQTEDLTVFDSTGLAFADHLVLDMFLDCAAGVGIGEKISILDGAVELHSPYSRLVTVCHVERQSSETVHAPEGVISGKVCAQGD